METSEIVELFPVLSLIIIIVFVVLLFYFINKNTRSFMLIIDRFIKVGEERDKELIQQNEKIFKTLINTQDTLKEMREIQDSLLLENKNNSTDFKSLEVDTKKLPKSTKRKK